MSPCSSRQHWSWCSLDTEAPLSWVLILMTSKRCADLGCPPCCCVPCPPRLGFYRATWQRPGLCGERIKFHKRGNWTLAFKCCPSDSTANKNTGNPSCTSLYWMLNCQQDFQVIWQKGYRTAGSAKVTVGFINHFPFFKLIHNGPLQSASMFFVTCLERRKKKRKEGGRKGGWAVKSRLGSELLIYSGSRGVSEGRCSCLSRVVKRSSKLLQVSVWATLFRVVTRNVNLN